MTAADSESGRGGTAGVVDAVLVVDEGAVIAVEVVGREMPLVAAAGVAIVAVRKR